MALETGFFGWHAKEVNVDSARGHTEGGDPAALNLLEVQRLGPQR